MKIALIEKCGYCKSCVWDNNALVWLCVAHKGGVVIVDPNSSPRDDCPLLDLDTVLKQVEENCIYDAGYLGGEARRVWRAALGAVREAVAQALKGGGE